MARTGVYLGARPCRAPGSGSANVLHSRSQNHPRERWPSGLRRTLGKRVYFNEYRGFESHSLRHRLIRKTSAANPGILSNL